MPNTLEKIIADLEGPTVEAEKVAESTPVENQETNEEVNALRKLASDLREQGAEIARGFIEELNKVAVGVGPLTPNTGAIPDNPAVQVTSADVRNEDTAKVEAIIKKLTLGGEAKVNPAGAVHEQNVPVAATQPIVVDEAPVAADAAKQANAEIVERLYAKYF